MKPGEVCRLRTVSIGFNACEPVKMVITSDRSEATYTFGQ